MQLSRLEKGEEQIMYRRYIYLLVSMILMTALSVGCRTKKDNNKNKSEDNTLGHIITSANVVEESEQVEPPETAINFDDWLYFGNPDDRYHIYRIQTDGSNLKKVVDARMEGFGDLTEWIYYIDTSEAGTPGKLARIKWDGSGKEILIEEHVEMLRTSEKYVFYAFENNIYRMNLDGSANMKLVSSDEKVCYMAYYEEVIYYSTNEGLFSITEDGTHPYHIKEGNFPEFQVRQNRIYYFDDNIYSISLKGVEESTVFEERVEEGYLWDNRIFYNKGDELYMVDAGAETSRKLYIESHLREFYRKDNRLYFYGNNRIWRVNEDLTEKEIFLGTGEEYLANMFVQLDGRVITKNVDVEEDSTQMPYKLFELMNDGTNKKLSDVAVWLIESKRGKVLYTDATDKKLYEIDVASNTKKLILDKMIGSFMSYLDMIYYTDIQQGYRLYAYDRLNGQHMNITNIAVSNLKRTKDAIYFLDHQKRMGILDLETSIPKYLDIFTTKYDVLGDTIYYKNEDDLGRLYRMATDGSKKEALTDEPVVDVYVHRESIFTYEDDQIDDKGQVYYVIKNGGNLLYSINNDANKSKFLDIVSPDLVDIGIIDGILYMHIASEGGSYYTLEKYVDDLEYKVTYDMRKQIDSKQKYFVYPINELSGYLYSYVEKTNAIELVLPEPVKDFQISGNAIYYSGYDMSGQYQPFIKKYNMKDKTSQLVLQIEEGNVLNFAFIMDHNQIYYCYDGEEDYLMKKNLDTGETITLSTNSQKLGAVVDGWVYYEDKVDGGSVLRTRIDGSVTENLTSTKRRYVYANKKYLYYLFVTEEASQKGILIKRTLSSGKEQVVIEGIGQRDMMIVEDHLYYISNGLNDYDLSTGRTRNIYPNQVDYFTLQGEEIHLSVHDGEKYKTIIMPLDPR